MTLRPAGECDVARASEVPTDEVGMRRYELPEQLPPRLRITRTYLFEGGCVTYRFAVDGDARAAFAFGVDQALTFQPRATLVDAVRDLSDLGLCGAGVSCPGGRPPPGIGGAPGAEGNGR
ncbi:MAG: hypothetical protein GEV08_18760 [Acidimicrobiia bacterium]|nr:hypothetical protein [Acidimicrobiia bacterium]